MIFINENVNNKLQWMNFFINIGNKFFFAKIEKKKRNRMEEIYVGLFRKNRDMKWNVEVILQVRLHVSLLLNIFQLYNIKII